MTEYEELQARHQELLAEIEADSESETALKSVQDYIERVKGEAEKIPDPRERDQLRANLRFWAAFVFDRTGTYPNTTLRPSAALPPSQPPLAPLPPSQPLPAAPKKTNFWIWGGGGLILVLILVVLVYPLFLTPLQNAYPAARLTNVAQQTAISLISTSTSQAVFIPTNTPAPGNTVEAGVPTSMQRTATPVPRTATPPPTNSPVPRTATVAALFTQIAAASTLARSATPTATPEIPVEGTEVSGGYELAADVFSKTQTQVCTSRSVEVRIAPDSRVSPGKLFEADVNISQAGNPDILDSAALSTENNPISIDLTGLNVLRDTSFFLQLNHPDYPASNVIFLFSPDCSNETLSLDYYLQERNARLPEQPTPNPNLSLDWRLLTWGPVPDPLSGGESDRWVASIALLADGPEEQQIFWAQENNADFQPLPDNKILIEGQACKESRTLVGLTSGGQSTLRELLILSPYCPEGMLHVPLTTTSVPTPTSTATPTPAPARTPTPTPPA